MRASIRCAAYLLILFTASQTVAEDIERGRRIYQACASCHTLESERSTFGPSLKGVLGRHAAAVPDYKYSTGLRDAANAGLVWNDSSLAAFLKNPKKVVPGTTMRFWGLWDGEVGDLLAFLKASTVAPSGRR